MVLSYFCAPQEIELKAIMRTSGISALIALYAGLGLTTLDDLVAMTVGTQHGNQYHDALLLKQSATWHT
jgi:hypothetical protein